MVDEKQIQENFLSQKLLVPADRMWVFQNFEALDAGCDQLRQAIKGLESSSSLREDLIPLMIGMEDVIKIAVDNLDELKKLVWWPTAK